MGMFDKVNELKEQAEKQMADHPEQTEKYSDEGIERAGDAIDKLTGGKYAEQIDKAQDEADRKLGQ
jgi:hypothetical protein